MKFYSLLAVINSALLLASISPGELSAQSDATIRLMELIDAGDISSVEEKLPRAAIDAGPPAIPGIRSILAGSIDSIDKDRRLLALAAAVHIGGDAAISLVRGQYGLVEDDTFRTSIAAVLASADTPAGRRELIGMISGEATDFDTISTAAFSLGILRADEAAPGLRAVITRRPNSMESNAADLALKWIEKGYWAVETAPDNEQGRTIAAVLRNGSPSIAEKDYVFDEGNGGFWRYGPSGWVFSRGRPTDGTQSGPSITTFVGAEGSRALVSVEMHCGMLCGTKYNFVLRKEGAVWRVQMILLVWIA
jgi:hypothetical protein